MPVSLLGGARRKDEVSIGLANEWWTAKLAELEAQEKQTPEAQAQAKLESLVAVMSPEELAEVIDRGKAAKLVELLITMRPDLAPDIELNFPGTFEKTKERLTGRVPQDRTVKAQTARWLEGHRVTVKVGEMSPGRFDAYSRRIGLFAKWLGEENPVDYIVARKLEEYRSWLAQKMVEGVYSVSTAKEMLMTAKQFTAWLAEMDMIPLPGNLKSKRLGFKEGAQVIRIISPDDIKKILANCDLSEKAHLYFLLCLNCGMYQNDIAELGRSEVDFSAGTLKRSRSKTPKGPVVTYKLWPETLELLIKHRSKEDCPNDRGDYRLLLTGKGKPLVSETIQGEGTARYDTIHASMRLVFKRAGVKGTIKQLRKTSASMLEKHEVYGRYVEYFLGHSPKSVADRSYRVPSDDLFFQGCDWLRQQYGLSGGGRG